MNVTDDRQTTDHDVAECEEK